MSRFLSPDALVGLATVAMAFSACSVLGLIMIKSALDSSSLSGETLLATFLPSIPCFIIVNSSLELLIVPALLILGWRPGKRRVVIVGAAALFFVQRIWTYLVLAWDSCLPRIFRGFESWAGQRYPLEPTSGTLNYGGWAAR